MLWKGVSYLRPSHVIWKAGENDHLFAGRWYMRALAIIFRDLWNKLWIWWSWGALSEYDFLLRFWSLGERCPSAPPPPAPHLLQINIIIPFKSFSKNWLLMTIPTCLLLQFGVQFVLEGDNHFQNNLGACLDIFGLNILFHSIIIKTCIYIASEHLNSYPK